VSALDRWYFLLRHRPFLAPVTHWGRKIFFGSAAPCGRRRERGIILGLEPIAAEARVRSNGASLAPGFGIGHGRFCQRRTNGSGLCALPSSIDERLGANCRRRRTRNRRTRGDQRPAEEREQSSALSSPQLLQVSCARSPPAPVLRASSSVARSAGIILMQFRELRAMGKAARFRRIDREVAQGARPGGFVAFGQRAGLGPIERRGAAHREQTEGSVKGRCGSKSSSPNLEIIPGFRINRAHPTWTRIS
jgi:hypothetical protein